MTKPMTRIHNTETNEIIDREMTDDEFAEYKKVQANYQTIKAQAEIQALAKAELLTKLGITEDEAKLLLS
jgi:predicted metal-binding transcription factor (methanogenesis marker protein 9)